jgi:NAD+ kinase
MNKTIKKVRLFPNDNEQSRDIVERLTKLLEQYHLEIDDDDYDLAIAIGGDGAFLRMVKQTAFNSDIYYVGINGGTLGFLQEIRPSDIEIFVARINNGDFKIEETSIQETIVNRKTETSHFYSLNEIVIRDKDLNTTNLAIYINENLLGSYTGDGLLISTSVGSTAYNISYGGSIVYGGIHTLQITPIAPLFNKAYRSIINSVIVPEERVIKLIPGTRNKELLLTVDGENSKYRGVVDIVTRVGDKKIYCLRMNDYDYTNIIHDKFLK